MSKKCPEDVENDESAPRICTKGETAKHFGVSLVALDTWIRRGCPMVVTDGGSKRFDLGAMEVWLWFRKQRREDSFWRELCNRPAAELIEAARKAQGQLSFWTRANLDWNAPEAEAIHKALVKICEGCDELSDLAERHFPHLGRE